MSIELATLPYSLIRKVQEIGSDVAAVQAELLFEYASVKLSTEQVRDLIIYATQELEKDQLAGAPSSVDVLSRKIDTSLNKEIDRITEENRVLDGVARADPDEVYKIKGEKCSTTVVQAKERLAANMKRLLDIKKVVSEQKRAEGGATTNIQINMGDIVGQALKNIEKTEMPAELVGIE